MGAVIDFSLYSRDFNSPQPRVGWRGRGWLQRSPAAAAELAVPSCPGGEGESCY